MYIEREVYKSLVNWKNSGEEPLLVEGARQVGKTYLVKKFAEDNFSTYLYIDMASNSGDRFLSLLNKHKSKNSNKEMLISALTEFSSHFKDDSSTLVIIDEIQESYEVYNLIRSFNRECKCRFILTGSYLGRVSLDKKMWVSAGDLTKLEIKPLTFREFLKAVNSEVVSLFDTIDLYGSSPKEEYELLKQYYNIYLRVGGYPKAVLKFLRDGDITEVYKYHEELLETFAFESTKYLGSPLFKTLIMKSFSTFTYMLLNEKKGLNHNNFAEQVNKLEKNISYNLGGLNLSKEQYSKLLFWLIESHCLSTCDKVVECDLGNIIANQRYYFYDLGVFSFMLYKLKIDDSVSIGALNENYVNNVLRDKEFQPAFTTFANNEIDFIVKDFESIYGIEVKSGKNSGISVEKAYKKGLIDKILYLKGDTYGGVDGNKLTIPIYLFERFEFKVDRDYFSKDTLKKLIKFNI